MRDIAATAIAALAEHGLTVGTCESLTGGMICSALVDVPGASAVVRGGLITYQTDTKTLLAGVDAALIEAYGVVSAEVARAMAEGVRTRLRGAAPSAIPLEPPRKPRSLSYRQAADLYKSDRAAYEKQFGGM